MEEEGEEEAENEDEVRDFALATNAILYSKSIVSALPRRRRLMGLGGRGVAFSSLKYLHNGTGKKCKRSPQTQKHG